MSSYENVLGSLTNENTALVNTVDLDWVLSVSWLGSSTDTLSVRYALLVDS